MKAGGGSGKNYQQRGGQGKFQKKCDNCGRIGHRSANCWEKAENKDKRPKWLKDKSNGEMGAVATNNGKKVEFLLCRINKFLFPQNQDLLLDPNVWIADLAATLHTMAHKQGFHAMTKVTDTDLITMGNGIAEKASLVGKLTGTMCNKNGIQLGTATLTDVIHLPTGQFNLFSLINMTQQGWILGGDNKEIRLTKSRKRLSFDIAIPTLKGMLFAMYIWQDTEIAGTNTDTGPIILIQQAHKCLAQPGKEMTHKVSNELGWTLTHGNLKPCDACATGKAKQKNVPHMSIYQVTTEDKPRVFLDIATVKSPLDGLRVTKPNWRIIVNKQIRINFSSFFDTKNDMVKLTCKQFQRWKDAGKKVRFLRMDNSGENKSVQQRCESGSSISRVSTCQQ
jgi:hypothetical protein